MKTPKDVARLNELLRSELGEPRYGWVWSEDLLYVMQKLNDEGTPQYDFVCACGQNRSVHEPWCKSLVIPRPIYEHKKLFTQLNQQWVLCRQIQNPFSEYAWRQAFGSRMPFEKTTWAPCDPVYLEQGEWPNADITYEVIRCLRRDKEKTPKQVVDEAREAQAKVEQANRDRIRDQVKDQQTAFLGVPGEKGHWSVGGLKDTP
jgi:hypothetical protein